MNLPETPARLFFVGIGGIGMSGLAQLLVHQGYSVCGSDRGLDEPGKAELYDCLRQQGITLFPQDGSGIALAKPDALVVSTAVESSNPDLQAAQGIPVIHRARALSQALAKTGATLVAVAGSCGKTSVTGWVASALHAVGEKVLVVNGGYYAGNTQMPYPGNFRTDDSPKWAVAEIDESDKSISEFSPDYGLLLNVGNDHYGEDELRQVFSAFLSRSKRGAVTSAQLSDLASDVHCPKAFFDTEGGAPSSVYPSNYSMAPGGITFNANGIGLVKSSQSGHHSACNACAVLALLKMLNLGKTDAELAAAIAAFPGIRQRFEIMGTNSNGVAFINDYAHNPEKISAAISTARERFGSPIVAFFQPHGFTPLGFMREKLTDVLAQILQPGDSFCMLPVFYAGGTAAFSPTSAEVLEDVRKKAPSGINLFALDRPDAQQVLDATPNRTCVLVMGARDSSLRPWTSSLNA